MCDVEDLKSKNATASKPEKLLGVRHIQYVLMFFAAVIGYGMRTNLSQGIVAMTEESNENNPDIPTYPEWKDYKNTMLSSFFWGYVCLQIGAGEMAKKYGPKWFLGGAMFVSSIFSILIPILGNSMGYTGVILCRVFQGLSQGFLFPSFHHLLSVWTPRLDRSTVMSFVYTGGPLGNVISLPVTGLISSSKLGWPVAFYLYGGVGILWSILWFIFGSNTPSENKMISEDERKYIEAETSVQHSTSVATPWFAIVTSLPMSAILISHCGQNWGFWTLLTEIPSYLSEILGMNLKENSLLSALPYFVLWLLNFVMSPIADYLIKSNTLSVGKTRKIFNSIGLLVPALALIALSFVGHNSKTLAVTLLVIAVGLNSGTYVGFNVNHVDISPRHSGTLMGITNSLSNILSIAAPLTIDGIKVATGYEESNKNLWSIVFCLASGIYIFVCMYFNIFGSGEVQDWDDDHYLENKKKLDKQ